MANNIQILLESGFDAFSNLYSVSIIPPPNVGLPLSAEIRANDFKPPTLTLGEYDTHLRTANITRVNAKFTGDREFQLQFRIDSNWSLYEALKKWKRKYVDIGNDEVYLGSLSEVSAFSEMYGTVTVRAFETNNHALTNMGTESESIVWIFKQVMLYDIIEPNFVRNSSEPIMITCKFLFGEYESLPDLGTEDKPDLS